MEKILENASWGSSPTSLSIIALNWGCGTPEIYNCWWTKLLLPLETLRSKGKTTLH